MLLEIFLMLIKTLVLFMSLTGSSHDWKLLEFDHTSYYSPLCLPLFSSYPSQYTHTKKELYWILRYKDRNMSKLDKTSSICHLKRHRYICKVNTCIHMCFVQPNHKCKAFDTNMTDPVK